MDNSRQIQPSNRFPEFSSSGSWDYVPGNELFIPIVNKNHNSDLPVLAITQDQGAVPRDLIDYNVIVSDKSIAGYKVVEIGDFIISLRSFQGGIEYSNYKGLCSPAYIVLRRKNDTICNDFYRHYFKSKKYIQDLNRNLEGIRDGKMISYQQFSEIKIPFPSLAEQKRIAECLSTIDEAIAENNSKLELLKSHKKGLIQKLFPAKGQKIPELRFKEFLDKGEWEMKRLGDITEMYAGATPSTIVSEYWIDGTIPWMSSGEVNNGQIFRTEKKITKLGFENCSTKLVPPNSVVVALAGQGKTRGMVAITRIELCTNQSLCSIIPSKTYDSDFLYYYLHGRYEYLRQISSGDGTRGGLNLQMLKDFVVPFPSLVEQKRIAELLSAADLMIAKCDSKLEPMKSHKKGLMQQLFPQQ